MNATKEKGESLLNNKDFACGDGVRFILSALKENGEKAYTVGGCVRDTLLGREPNDWDICTSALPERTAGIFRSLGCGVIETGLKHGTVTVRYHGENYEVTTFRKDCTYSDNRHPDAVEFVSDIKEDLSRRDFTINAMAYAPGEDVIDPFGGQTDLRFGIIRCVGDQRERFSEDALRILRAMRFASRYGFVIESETKDAMLALRGLLNNIAYERIREELLGILSGQDAASILREYQPIVTQVIPELSATVGFDQKSLWHIYDVWEHSLHVVDSIPADKPLLRFTGLVHDIAKPKCAQLKEDGRHLRFHGHGEAGEPIVRNIMNRLRFSNAEIASVTELVRIHDNFIDPTPRAVRRLLGNIGEQQFLDLMVLRKADISAQAEHENAVRYAKLVTLRCLARDITAKNECFSLKDLAVNGRDLIAAGIASGPELGKLLAALLDAVLEDPSKNTKEELLRLAQQLKEEENHV